MPMIWCFNTEVRGAIVDYFCEVASEFGIGFGFIFEIVDAGVLWLVSGACDCGVKVPRLGLCLV